MANEAAAAAAGGAAGDAAAASAAAAAAAAAPAAGAAAGAPGSGTPAAEAGKTSAAAPEGGKAGAAAGESTEGKAGAETGGKAGEGKGSESKAPEKYVLKVPEGAAALVNSAVVENIERQARDAGLTNEEAQGWLDETIGAAQAQSERFKAETLADADYGGDHFAETQRLAHLAIDRIRPAGHARRDPFLGFLDLGGASNHIEVVSFLADLGRLMSEDAPPHAPGLSGKAQKKSHAEVLFGDSSEQAAK